MTAVHRVTVQPYSDGDVLHEEIHVVCSAPECEDLITCFRRDPNNLTAMPWPTPAELWRVEQEHLSRMAKAGTLLGAGTLVAEPPLPPDTPEPECADCAHFGYSHGPNGCSVDTPFPCYCETPYGGV